MKSALLTSALGLTLLAASVSATAAVNTNETSVWRKIKLNPVVDTAKTEKSSVWRKIKLSPVSSHGTSSPEAEKTSVWRKIKL